MSHAIKESPTSGAWRRLTTTLLSLTLYPQQPKVHLIQTHTVHESALYNTTITNRALHSYSSPGVWISQPFFIHQSCPVGCACYLSTSHDILMQTCGTLKKQTHRLLRPVRNGRAEVQQNLKHQVPIICQLSSTISQTEHIQQVIYSNCQTWRTSINPLGSHWDDPKIQVHALWYTKTCCLANNGRAVPAQSTLFPAIKTIFAKLWLSFSPFKPVQWLHSLLKVLWALSSW